MAINFPGNPVNGNTYTYDDIVYTYIQSGSNEGYWKIATPGTVGIATPSDINLGVDNIKYITPYGLANSDYFSMEYVQAFVSQNISPNIRYGLSSNVSGIILTLPAVLNVGDTFYFSDINGLLETNPVTIARNGHLILGLDEDFQQDISYAPLDLVYTGAARGLVLL